MPGESGAPKLDLENYKKFYGFGIPKWSPYYYVTESDDAQNSETIARFKEFGGGSLPRFTTHAQLASHLMKMSDSELNRMRDFGCGKPHWSPYYVEPAYTIESRAIPGDKVSMAMTIPRPNEEGFGVSGNMKPGSRQASLSRQGKPSPRNVIDDNTNESSSSSNSSDPLLPFQGRSELIHNMSNPHEKKPLMYQTRAELPPPKRNEKSLLANKDILDNTRGQIPTAVRGSSRSKPNPVASRAEALLNSRGGVSTPTSSSLSLSNSIAGSVVPGSARSQLNSSREKERILKIEREREAKRIQDMLEVKEKEIRDLKELLKRTSASK